VPELTGGSTPLFTPLKLLLCLELFELIGLLIGERGDVYELIEVTEVDVEDTFVVEVDSEGTTMKLV
jgi:hypothetical protein